jgi:membrane-associated phospholipid phosphatase
MPGTRVPEALSADPAAPCPPASQDADHSPVVSLADPRVRLALGLGVMLITGRHVRSDGVGSREARAFRAVNGLPDSLRAPAWIIMQFGTLGAAPAAAAAAWAASDRKLAWRLLAGGSATWALSKVVKRNVRRPRPAMLLAGTRSRGKPASGLGYLSGHAGVAVALGTAALPRFGAAGRAVTAALVPIVGLSRVYVGAHLPLDIVGGAALGLAVDAAVALIQESAGLSAARPPSPGVRMTGVRHAARPVSTTAHVTCAFDDAGAKAESLLGRIRTGNCLFV